MVVFQRIEDHMNLSELSPENIKISNKKIVKIVIKIVKETHLCCQYELEKQRKIKQDSLKDKIVANENQCT